MCLLHKLLRLFAKTLKFVYVCAIIRLKFNTERRIFYVRYFFNKGFQLPR